MLVFPNTGIEHIDKRIDEAFELFREGRDRAALVVIVGALADKEVCPELEALKRQTIKEIRALLDAAPHFQACSYCRRQIVGGQSGRELTEEEYKGASHGACSPCVKDFEAGFSVEKIVARAKARAECLAIESAS